ncbi:unnamed protein product [Camellia sinensis]
MLNDHHHHHKKELSCALIYLDISVVMAIMGATQITFAAPAVAAALGIYFFDRIQANNKVPIYIWELGGGGGRLQTPVVSLMAKMKEEVKKSSQMPKLAPQFDGLHSFETLVG